MTTINKVSAVVIGRNEGDRLVSCLTSLKGIFSHVVYVDSGSSDQSVCIAKKAGVETIELDPDRPFSAARGRTSGAELLLNKKSQPEFIQFIDGDCVLNPGWVELATQALDRDQSLGVVTGWRSEINMNASIYNAMCDFEWRRPTGEVSACGGDMMVRAAAYRKAGGFNKDVIAAEDDEFCIRVRGAGWRIVRLPLEMTKHDANMQHFRQWWQRATRAGHGFAQVGAMHPGYFRTERLRVLLYGFALPIFGVIALIMVPWLTLLVLGLYIVSYLRTSTGLKRAGLTWAHALRQSVFLSLSKFPNFQGMMLFYGRRLRGHRSGIIEYKRTTTRTGKQQNHGI